MTDKELRKMGKSDLIEIIYRLMKSEEQLKAELSETNAQLADRNVKISEAGSLAEVAAMLNGIFDTAQRTADEYITMVRNANRDTEDSCAKKLRETEERCTMMLAQTNDECARLREDATNDCELKWSEFQNRADEYIKAHGEMQHFINLKHNG